MSMEELQLIFVPGPGSHIISAVEVGELILKEDTRLSITYILVNDTVVREYTNSSRFQSNPRLQFLNLPELEEERSPSSDFKTKSELLPVKAIRHIHRHKPLVKEAVLGIMAMKSRVVGFVVDMFCMTMTDIADEFLIPTYAFFAVGAGFLTLMMFMRRLTDEHGADITEFKGSNEKFPVAGFLKPVPATVLPSVMLDKDGSVAFMSLARRIQKTRGIFINTFQELEPNIIQSLSTSNDDQLPPVYAVGPLLNLETPLESKFSDVIHFLDQQPPKSVVFLCFGSLGSLSEAQIKNLAVALESTGRRFLWSLRRRNQSGSWITSESILPEGFLDRTKGIGRVIGWAPQAAVLAHTAVGGFVSHCGWHSVLESMWYGVPMAAWPLYAEQQMNAFEVVTELGIAVEVRVDYSQESGVLVSAEEIAAAIERLMEGKSGVRGRAEEMREKSSGTVVDGGSSRKFLARLVRDIMYNSSG